MTGNKEEVTTREIELWVEYMSPRFGASAAGDERLIDFYRATEKEGLGPHSANEMAAFVFGHPEKRPPH